MLRLAEAMISLTSFIASICRLVVLKCRWLNVIVSICNEERKGNVIKTLPVIRLSLFNSISPEYWALSDCRIRVARRSGTESDIELLFHYTEIGSLGPRNLSWLFRPTMTRSTLEERRRKLHFSQKRFVRTTRSYFIFCIKDNIRLSRRKRGEN